MYPTSGYDNYKYLCPQQGSSQLRKPTVNQNKETKNNNTLIVGDLNTPLSAIDRTPKQKINKETRALNDIPDQRDLIGIYRTFHPETILILFKCTWNFLQNRPYTGSRNRSELIPKDRDYSLHILGPQCFETGTQSQAKIWKKQTLGN